MVRGHADDVVAVEPRTSAALHAALQEGRPVAVAPSGIAADSLGASTVGTIAFDVARRTGMPSVLVGDDDIWAARQWLWREAGSPRNREGPRPSRASSPEPSSWTTAHASCVVVCGANADPATLVD